MSPFPPDQPPEDESKNLWQHVIKDVRPLKNKTGIVQIEDSIQAKPAVAQSSPPTQTDRPVTAKSDQFFKTGGLDRRTEQKLKQGKMPIEGRLDLHGLTLEEAHQEVRKFIRLYYQSGKRCVLIITGKGEASEQGAWYEGSRGQIRRNFRHWLDDADLKPLILSVSAARRDHGGGGAFYVLLRRQR